MYLHIGGQKMVDIRQIVAIFKAHPKKTKKSNPLRQYYKPFVRVDGIGEEKVRCYVVTEDCIYGSPIALETIVSRYCRLFQRKKGPVEL